MSLIIYLACLAIQIILSLSVFKRKDLDIVGKIIVCLIIILVPYMLGAAFYYFYAQHHIAQWLKKIK
uniref:hypothetical protein n=1 Tax=Alistipes sp. TaxID=1872444 RepID=UPI0040560FC0